MPPALPPLLIVALIIPATIYTELRHGKIYNWLTLPALGAGVLLASLSIAEPRSASVLAAAVLGIALAALPFLSEKPRHETALLITAGLGLSACLAFGDSVLRSHLWAAALGGGVFAIPYLLSGIRRGIPVVGGGDVKLAAALGALLGLNAILTIVYYSVWIGLALAVIYILHGRVLKKRTSDESEPSRPVLTMRIPFGTAICLAVLLFQFTS